MEAVVGLRNMKDIFFQLYYTFSALAQVSGAILGEVQGFESSKPAKDVASINTAMVTGRKVGVAAVKKRGWCGENGHKRLV